MGLTLVSFLGKGRNSKQRGYRQANYDFGKGFSRDVPFFGLALAEYLKPQQLILVGTSGSMWDVFFEQQGSSDDDVLNLMEAVEKECVNETMLIEHERHLSNKLGIPVKCLLIPYAKTTPEQANILQDLAKVVQKGEKVTLDVTHGFRHLPMLALVAARYLTQVADVKVEEVYYGALEMTVGEEKTPVLRLGGLLSMLDWVEALATYKKDGDYSAFAYLLNAEKRDNDDMNTSDKTISFEKMGKAAFFERTGNPVKARETLNSVFHAVENHEGVFSSLFRDELKNRISWFRGKQRDEWELSLADAYFERHDYLRATVFLYEGFVTRAAIKAKLDHNNFQEREEAFSKAKEGQPEEIKKLIKDLKLLRNTLAHGVKANSQEIRSVIENETKLQEYWQQCRKKLFY